MIVCSCYGITENDYRQALRSGATRRDPRRQAEQQLAAWGKACPAGHGCGSCLLTLLALAEDETADRKSQLACSIGRQS